MKNLFSWTLLIISMFSCSDRGKTLLVTPNQPEITYTGRFDFSDKNKPVFMYSGCAIKTIFTGTSVELIMKDDSLRNLFTVILDDSLFVITTNRSDSKYLLADNLPDTSHKLEIYKRTEWHGGNTTFLGLRLDYGSELYKPEIKQRSIEFIGDSYTCGYGNEGLSQAENFKYETENNYLSFGAITARALNAEYVMVCRSGIGIVQGYGGNRAFTMPEFYDEVINNSPVKWNYQQFQPHAVVIDLAGNDFSAPLDSAEFVNRYLLFLQRIRNNYKTASIICLAGPSSANEKWQHWKNYIHAIVNEFGKTDNSIAYFEFSPFEPHGSDWHPNVLEHQKMADEFLPFLKNYMNWY